MITAALALIAQDTIQQDAPIAPPTQQQAPAAPPAKGAVRATARRVEGLGAAYEWMGRCAGSMAPDVIANVLNQARAQAQLGPFLLARFEKGFRHPTSDAKCQKGMGGEGADAPTP